MRVCARRLASVPCCAVLCCAVRCGAVSCHAVRVSAGRCVYRRAMRRRAIDRPAMYRLAVRRRAVRRRAVRRRAVYRHAACGPLRLMLHPCSSSNSSVPPPFCLLLLQPLCRGLSLDLLIDAAEHLSFHRLLLLSLQSLCLPLHLADASRCLPLCHRLSLNFVDSA